MPRVTLSFDNGPEPAVTPLVLDCLATHGVQSSFFVIGRKLLLPGGADLARRASAEGHWLGNHTFTHSKPLGLLPEAEALEEFDQTERAIAALGISQPEPLFRPYGGAGVIGPHLLQPAVVQRMIAGGYTCLLWNSLSRDWVDPEGWLDRAIADVQERAWSLLVLHDIPSGSMLRLAEFLGRLKSEGVEFTQEFPPECVPLKNGKIVLPMAAYCQGYTEGAS